MPIMTVRWAREFIMQGYHFSPITQRFALVSALFAAVVSAQAEASTVPANVVACRACHGAAGTSLNPTIPNLAGQKPIYLEGQLKAFRSKHRKNDFMNVIAVSSTIVRLERRCQWGAPRVA
jgi:cytochrome c553